MQIDELKDLKFYLGNGKSQIFETICILCRKMHIQKGYEEKIAILVEWAILEAEESKVHCNEIWTSEGCIEGRNF